MSCNHRTTCRARAARRILLRLEHEAITTAFVVGAMVESLLLDLTRLLERRGSR